LSATVAFEVKIRAIGKERPQAGKNRRTGRTIIFTPKKTKGAEKVIGYAARREFREPWDGPIRVDIIATFADPKRTPYEWCTETPDADNIAKLVCDAMNRIAYHDDAQVCALGIEKRWGLTDKINVTVTRLG